MAQHIETKHLPQKAFRKIEESFTKAFARGLTFIRGSFRFKEIDFDDRYKESENDVVFTAVRTIPEGIVHGTNKGNFELHYDEVKHSLTKIYHVA